MPTHHINVNTFKYTSNLFKIVMVCQFPMLTYPRFMLSCQWICHYDYIQFQRDDYSCWDMMSTGFFLLSARRIALSNIYVIMFICTVYLLEVAISCQFYIVSHLRSFFSIIKHTLALRANACNDKCSEQTTCECFQTKTSCFTQSDLGSERYT